MTTNTNLPSQNVQQEEAVVNINLIEEFMNISEDELKIIMSFKDEFTDMKFFNYGVLIYVQEEDDLSSFPHVSELLENYEKVFSTNCYLGVFVLRQTKFYVTYNDGLVIQSDNGIGDVLNIFKIKNLVFMYSVRKQSNKSGDINLRALRILKSFNFI